MLKTYFYFSIAIFTFNKYLKILKKRLIEKNIYLNWQKNEKKNFNKKVLQKLYRKRKKHRPTTFLCCWKGAFFMVLRGSKAVELWRVGFMRRVNSSLSILGNLSPAGKVMEKPREPRRAFGSVMRAFGSVQRAYVGNYILFFFFLQRTEGFLELFGCVIRAFRCVKSFRQPSETFCSFQRAFGSVQTAFA